MLPPPSWPNVGLETQWRQPRRWGHREDEAIANHRRKERFQPLMVLTGRSSIPLRLSPHRRVLAGVCGGIAEWLGIDAWWMRALYIGLTIFWAGFPAILVYLALWIGLPRE
jgi:phage shock protein PspC (stress-responsive transcriptional regulator)